MEIIGYCTIAKDADCSRSLLTPEDWQGKDVRVMEFSRDGGALVLSSDGANMGMFEKKDIKRRFECGVSGIVITPPGLDIMHQMAYATKAQMRKGGYNQLLAAMVVQASLMKGEFHDSFLWAKQ